MSRIASLCLVALMPLVACVYAAPPEQHSRIINGDVIQIEDIPFLVQLRYKHSNAFLCGGSLVTPTHVVTAAHCIEGRDLKDYVIVGGANTRFEKGIRRNIIKGVMHPYYNNGVRHTHDAAVLKLESPLVGDNVGTVPLCSQDDVPDGGDLQVSGWGKTERGYGSDVARTVTVSRIPFEQCEKQYDYTRLSGTMMCASVPGDKDACQGDSGGPAIYNGRLCGIVSWGRGCAQAKYPGIYTNVNTVQAFIGNALLE